jgi:hypothetical protein
VFKALSRGAAKYASAKLRSAKLLPTSGDWLARTAVCARCPLYTLHNGAPHCGKPLLQQPVRVAKEGCGCPIAAKAQDPGEHCPLTRDHEPISEGGTGCDCKWCTT